VGSSAVLRIVGGDLPLAMQPRCAGMQGDGADVALLWVPLGDEAL